MKPSMLRALRKAIDVAIKVDPKTIVLVPNNKIKKPGGVYDYAKQPPRAPQTFILEPVGSTLTGISGTNGGAMIVDGITDRKWDYTLTGRWDSQVAIGDSWKDGDTTYRVISLQPDNEYSKVAVISALGGDPKYGS